MDEKDASLRALERIAEALERLAPPSRLADPLPEGEAAFLWQGREGRLVPRRPSAWPLALFTGVEAQMSKLADNTARFAEGAAAHNALLWGARGCGKSSLVKAVHASLLPDHPSLALVGLAQAELQDLPLLLDRLGQEPGRRFILFCDDLAFQSGEAAYRALKSVLDGGMGDQPANCAFYATSNRRHLLPREAWENERSDALRPEEVAEDHLSLSDRFGLSLGFHPLSERDYLAAIAAYAAHFKFAGIDAELVAGGRAALFARERGGPSGRCAWQFIRDYAARNNLKLS